MSITVNLKGKSYQLKPTNTFGDLFDYSNEKGKFTEYDFYINGQIQPSITKATKLNTLLTLQTNDVEMTKKGSQPPSQIFQQNKPQETQQIPQPEPIPNQGQSNPQPPSFQPGAFPVGGQNKFPANTAFNPAQNKFAAPTQFNAFKPAPNPNQGIPAQPTFPTPTPPSQVFQPPVQPPVPTQPVISNPSSKRKVIEFLPQISDSVKQINDYKITIRDQGMTVDLEHLDGEFRAIFKEENAVEVQNTFMKANIDAIKACLQPSGLETDPATVSKVVVGKDNSSTKVLFLKGFVGLAIQWATGLYTHFQFWVEK